MEWWTADPELADRKGSNTTGSVTLQQSTVASKLQWLVMQRTIKIRLIRFKRLISIHGLQRLNKTEHQTNSHHFAGDILSTFLTENIRIQTQISLKLVPN